MSVTVKFSLEFYGKLNKFIKALKEGCKGCRHLHPNGKYSNQCRYCIRHNMEETDHYEAIEKTEAED